MPLWRSAIGLVELRALLSEGRATIGRRAAKDGLDFIPNAQNLWLEFV
jgi:CRISPR-associated protein Csx17